MKKAFLLTTIAVYCITLTAFAQQKKQPLYSITLDSIGIEFTTKFVMADLEQIKSELKKVGAEIKYTSLKFDKSGHLQQIAAAIKFPNGNEGSFTSRELQPRDRPGFRMRLK